LFGVTPLLRYNFATGSGWMPFVDFGAGVTYTDIGRPNLSTRFQFNDQAGLGAHCFLRQDVAVTVQYRFVHLSNAGMKEPNLGVDAHVFSVGVTRLF
jgi:opacity protein-like surface antigen